MLRVLRWLLLALYLIVVAVWHPAAAPIELAVTGAAVLLAAVPVPVWLFAGAVAWLRHQPAPVREAV
jgi:hypothetical protein